MSESNFIHLPACRIATEQVRRHVAAVLAVAGIPTEALQFIANQSDPAMRLRALRLEAETAREREVAKGGR